VLEGTLNTAQSNNPICV